jgi:hypothetical protein
MKTLVTLIFLGLAACAWGPWVDDSFAKSHLALDSKERNRSGDSCEYADILTSNQTVFGRIVTARYLCEETEMKRNMFISVLGKTFSLNKYSKLSPDSDPLSSL